MIKKSIIELYLNVKIRTYDKVCMIDEESLKIEKK